MSQHIPHAKTIQANFNGRIETIITQEHRDGTQTSSTCVQHFYEGQLHRLDGPAMEFSTGSKYWYHHGLRHREDGPAVVVEAGEDSVQEWYVHDRQVTEEEFQRWLEMKALNAKLEGSLPPKPAIKGTKI